MTLHIKSIRPDKSEGIAFSGKEAPGVAGTDLELESDAHRTHLEAHVARMNEKAEALGIKTRYELGE